MSTPETLTALERVTPGWSPALRRAVVTRSGRISRGDGQRLFGPGDRAQGYIVPLQGTVRVEHMGESGRSVVLYRVAPGDTCVMTTACLITGAPYQAWGYADGDVEALALSASAFQDLLDTDRDFRAMAFAVFASRIRELVEVIDELLLHRVDLRLAAWLAERAPTVAATHQAIAGELGTAREVVSRILKDFERRGWIALARGEIAVGAPDALKMFAAQR